MGIVAILSLAVAAAGTVASGIQARKASKARREGQAVSTASGNIRDKLARRRNAREERVRRARLVQQSETAGATGSSGMIGATSALGASFGASAAAQRGDAMGAMGISAANERAASATSKGQLFGSLADLAGEGLSIWDDYKNG
tara:strand:- start:441 stop:872 length:432 start_codon:yes stop_codon:yes gene_type:complete